MSRTVSCEFCGSDFVCEGGPTCWCVGIQVPRKRRKEIEREAADCVCRHCLTSQSLDRGQEEGANAPVHQQVGGEGEHEEAPVLARDDFGGRGGLRAPSVEDVDDNRDNHQGDRPDESYFWPNFCSLALVEECGSARARSCIGAGSMGRSC